MQFMTISTVNFQTFSELAFKFTLTPGIVVESMIFSLSDGIDRRRPASAARLAPEDCRRAQDILKKRTAWYLAPTRATFRWPGV